MLQLSIIMCRFCLYLSYFFFCYSDVNTRDLHSFPTRRSSDLFIAPNGPVRETRFKKSNGVPDGNVHALFVITGRQDEQRVNIDRKSTRLNSSHTVISYAVFCLKKKKKRSSPSAHILRQ